MKELKRTVASQIYNKRKLKNQPTSAEENFLPDVAHMSAEDRELYELRQLMGNTEDTASKGSKTGRERFRNYEYKKHDRKIHVSSQLIPMWLEHPNPKYLKGNRRIRCQHGIKCKGKRSLNTTTPCIALHPWEWEMLSDEYLQYIIDLPVKPKENINEGIYS